MTTTETRPRHRVRRSSLLLVAALLAAILLTACQTPGFLQSDLPDDGPPIATSQAAAVRFVEKVTAAGENAVETKRLNLTLSEVELTSFLSAGSKLAEQLQAHDVQNLADLERLQGSAELQEIEGLQEWMALLRAHGGFTESELA